MQTGALGALLAALAAPIVLAQGSRRAHHVTAPRYSVQIQAVFDAAGNPLLVANFSPNGSLAQASWSICRPPDVSRCKPAAAVSRGLEPGAEPAGTVFRASSRYRGQLYTARVTWHGRVRSQVRPTLSGAPRVGSRVAPAHGRWSGGWGGEYDQRGVEACRTPDGSDCVILAGGGQGCPVESAAAVVGGWFTGWYLFALDQRLARDSACAGVGYGLAADIPLWKLGQTAVRSAPYGPLTGPPAPAVSIRKLAVLRGDQVLFATLSCSSTCEFWATANDRAWLSGGHGTTTGSAADRTTTLIGVSRGKLRAGPLTVTINVDGSPAISGKTELP